MLLLDRVRHSLSPNIECDPYVPITITFGDEASGLDFWSPRVEDHDTIVEVRTSREDGSLRQIVVSSIASLSDMPVDAVPDFDNAEQAHPVLRREGVAEAEREQWYEREAVQNLDVSLGPNGVLFVRWSTGRPTRALDNERVTFLFDAEQEFVGFLVSKLTPEEISLLRDA